MIPVVDAVAGVQSIGRDAEDPARGAVQVDVAADDGRGGYLVVEKAEIVGRMSAQFLLEVAIRSAKEGMDSSAPCLLCGPSHSGPAAKMYWLTNGPWMPRSLTPAPLEPR